MLRLPMVKSSCLHYSGPKWREKISPLLISFYKGNWIYGLIQFQCQQGKKNSGSLFSESQMDITFFCKSTSRFHEQRGNKSGRKNREYLEGMEKIRVGRASNTQFLSWLQLHCPWALSAQPYNPQQSSIGRGIFSHPSYKDTVGDFNEFLLKEWWKEQQGSYNMSNVQENQ